MDVKEICYIYSFVWFWNIVDHWYIDNRQYLLVLTHLQYMVMTHKERYTCTCKIYIISTHVGATVASACICTYINIYIYRVKMYLFYLLYKHWIGWISLEHAFIHKIDNDIDLSKKKGKKGGGILFVNFTVK